jgi:hypothetical protein
MIAFSPARIARQTLQERSPVAAAGRRGTRAGSFPAGDFCGQCVGRLRAPWLGVFGAFGEPVHPSPGSGRLRCESARHQSSRRSARTGGATAPGRPSTAFRGSRRTSTRRPGLQRPHGQARRRVARGTIARTRRPLGGWPPCTGGGHDLLGVVEVACTDHDVVEVGVDIEQEDRPVAAAVGEPGDHAVAGAPYVAQPDHVAVGPQPAHVQWPARLGVLPGHSAMSLRSRLAAVSAGCAASGVPIAAKPCSSQNGASQAPPSACSRTRDSVGKRVRRTSGRTTCRISWPPTPDAAGHRSAVR